MNESVYPKRFNIRWRWDGEDGEHITFQHPRSNAINVLNPIGALVFYLSDGNHSVKDIIEHVMEVYDAPSREVVANDVYNFVDYMARTGITMLLEDRVVEPMA